MFPSLFELCYLQTFFNAEDRVEKIQASVCKSQHMAGFYGILYAIDGLLLLFGVFLAWETRKVNVVSVRFACKSRKVNVCGVFLAWEPERSILLV